MQHLIVGHGCSLAGGVLTGVLWAVAQRYAGRASLGKEIGRRLLAELEHLPSQITDLRLRTTAAANFEPVQ